MSRKRLFWGVTALALTCCWAAPTLAQDSVSHTADAVPGNAPGDALSPWDVTQQCEDYVVDLRPFRASWGTSFEIAPLVKSSKVETEFFNALISSQTISRVHAMGEDPFALEYHLWELAPGYGINYPTRNNQPTTILPPVSTNQFSVAFAEYGGGDPVAEQSGYNAIIGAMVNYDPACPSRLYVHRVNAALGGCSADDTISQFGLGAVDEMGNIMFRADDYLLSGTCPLPRLQNDNIFRVDMTERTCGELNYISNNGASDTNTNAAEWIVQRHAQVHNAPNMGPTAVFGSPPPFLGSNFSTQYGYGTTNPPTYTTSHLIAPAVDHRGAVAYTTHNVPCMGGTHGTAGILGYDSSSVARYINVWSPNATGGVIAGSQKIFTLNPNTIQDNVTGMTPCLVCGDNEFDHYHSQTAYRGGTSQIALGMDEADRLLAAGVVYMSGNTSDPLSYIVLARLTCPDTVDWTTVGYACDSTGALDSGKPILSGPSGDPNTIQIGNMVGLDEVTGGTPAGPSVSGPMIDSVGNIWFVSAVKLTHYYNRSTGTWELRVNDEEEPDPDYDSALLRAVYCPDWNGTGLPGYELELVLELGSRFVGENSGVPWRIDFMGIADSNSVSSATAWSSNISEKAHLGVDPAAYDLELGDPRALGGMIVNVDISYDINGDGVFNDPTSEYADPEEEYDESYQVIVYLGAGSERDPDADQDGDVDLVDFQRFQQCLTAPDAGPFPCPQECKIIDLDYDGDVDMYDYAMFHDALGGPS